MEKMNRRSFLTSLIKGAVGCAILPSAVTYARTWKRSEVGGLYTLVASEEAMLSVNPNWVSSKYEMLWLNNGILKVVTVTPKQYDEMFKATGRLTANEIKL